MFSLQEKFSEQVGRLAASDTGQRFLVWQSSLNSRDRRALQLLGTFLLLVLFVVLVLYPPLRIADAARTRLAEQQDLLSWMRANEARARALAPVTAAREEGGQTLQAMVSGSASQHGLSLRRLEPVSEQELRIWMDGVAFNELLSWLDRLARQNVHVADLTLDRDEAPGRVNVRIGLQG